VGRGRPIDRSRWPGDRPQRTFFELLDRVHRDHGLKSQDDIARAMNLRAKSRVSKLLRGTLPADQDQANALIRALGGSDEDAKRGAMLYCTIRSSPTETASPRVPSREGRAGRESAGTPRLAGGMSAFQQAYLWQVQQFAPPSLAARDAELEKLARFCLDPDGPPYAWWQAEPWAGKSALLATFVLRPPPEVAERVTLVPFFITTQRAAHNTRGAFIQVLFEQLSALLGESAPTALPQATIETTLLERLSRAAIEQDQAGRRLVLVVDGLDEDRGAASGLDAQSIAGMLPARLPGGMRVIVASRPNPPLPGDVPSWHPLRDSSVILPLSPYQDAERFEVLARSELRHFLGHGSEAERDLLGFLTAARGGLSARDLAWLAEIDLWEAEAFLDTGEGSRMLRGRPGLAAASRRVFLLGHDDLGRLAEDYFDGQRLGRYRERLNSWATTWRARGWPPDTPEYLLIDYFQFLDELGALSRMTEYALDTVRHDRMLALTGGDAPALAEVRTALNRIAAQGIPDVASALALACHRDHLADRGTRVPVNLPAVWAVLGQLPRALALADSFTYWPDRVKALAQIAGALAETGQHREAMRITKEVEAIAWTLTVDSAPGRPEYADLAEGEVLVEVAKALARAGKHQNAVSLAKASLMTPHASEPGWDQSALQQVALVLAETGQHQHIAELDRNGHFSASDLATVAIELAGAGRHQEAMRIAKKAEAMARCITVGDELIAEVLADVAKALARLGKDRRSAIIVEEARDIAYRNTYQYGMLKKVAGALARCGRYQQGLEIARAHIADPRHYAEAVADIAVQLAEAGDYQRAVDLAYAIADLDTPQRHQDSNTFHSFDGSLLDERIDECLARVAGVLARCRRYPQALHLADIITGLDAQLMVLVDVGQELARDGQYQQAMDIAAKAEAIAHGSGWKSSAPAEIARRPVRNSQHQESINDLRDEVGAFTRAISDAPERTGTLADVAGALTETGRYAEARKFADAIKDSWSRAFALTEIAEAMARAGQQEEAAAISEEVLAISKDAARSKAVVFSEASWRFSIMRGAARALAWSGEQHRAEVITAIIRHGADPADMVVVIGLLADFAAALAWRGEHDQAIKIATQVESMALEFEEGVAKYGVAEAVTGALAWTGQHERAMDIARKITDPGVQATALGAVAGALAWTGQHEQAIDIARKIPTSYAQSKTLAAVARGLARTGGSRSCALQAVAVVCAAERWTTSVRAVLELVPSAFEMLVRVLRDQPFLPHE
jgi:tetratricopeptide (TPR) repeat protein